MTLGAGGGLSRPPGRCERLRCGRWGHPSSCLSLLALNIGCAGAGADPSSTRVADKVITEAVGERAAQAVDYAGGAEGRARIAADAQL
jgi:hypothetical protein